LFEIPSPPLYNDLNKKATDLLSKEFPTTHKIEFNTGKKPGPGFEASIADKDGVTVGTLTPKYIWENLYGKNTLAAGVDTKRTLKLEATSVDFVKGLKTIVTATDSQTVTGTIEYKQQHFTINTVLNLLSPKGTTGVFGTVFGYDGHAVGLQTDYNISTNTLNDINGSVTFNPDSFVSLGLFGRFKKNILGARFYYHFDKDFQVAAEAEANYVNTAEIPKFTLGAIYAVDTKTSIKGKIDTTGNVSAAVTSKLGDRVKVTFGTGLNTNNFSPTSKASFGLNLTVE